MKHLAILLALSLLLAGCGRKPEDLSSETTPPVTQTQPEGTGLYDPDSSLEQETDGGVKCYPLDEDTYTDLTFLGSDLLLQSRDHTRLTLLTGKNLIPVVEKEVTFHIGAVHTGSQGIAYLDQQNGTVFFLNPSLHQTSTMKLPEDLLGQIWLSPDWNALYYCTESGIRAMDMRTGITRTILAQKNPNQTLTGIFMDGTVLRCEIPTAEGSTVTQLVDCTNGTILWQGNTLLSLDTSGGNWFACMEQGTVQELLFGQHGQVWNLWLENDSGSILPLPEKKAVLVCQEAPRGFLVSYYDLTAGKCTAAVSLTGIANLKDACIDPEGNGIWLLTQTADDGMDMICHWTPVEDPTADRLGYTDLHYTRGNPDLEGLEALETQLQTFQHKYGIQILIAENPAAILPEGCRIETEYLVQAFERCIPLLQQAIDQFPEGFFTKAAQHSPSGQIRIGLVRELRGVVSGMPVIHQWQDGEFSLILAMDEHLEQNFYHGICHLIETRILSTSSALYDWEHLNPKGFSYDNDYIKNLDRAEKQYLTGENRAFIDTFSMSYAKEDWASVFEYACQPGYEDLFRFPILQQKLQHLCSGIREAFDLQGEAYLWEQHLQTDA